VNDAYLTCRGSLRKPDLRQSHFANTSQHILFYEA